MHSGGANSRVLSHSRVEILSIQNVTRLKNFAGTLRVTLRHMYACPKFNTSNTKNRIQISSIVFRNTVKLHSLAFFEPCIVLKPWVVKNTACFRFNYSYLVNSFEVFSFGLQLARPCTVSCKPYSCITSCQPHTIWLLIIAL